MKENQQKDLINDIINNYQKGDITVDRFKEDIANIGNTEKHTINNWIQEKENINIENLLDKVEKNPKPYLIDTYQPFINKNIKSGKAFEVAESGLNIILGNTGHCKTLFSVNLFCEIIKRELKACYISVEESETDIVGKIGACYYNKLSGKKDRITRTEFIKNIRKHKTTLELLTNKGLVLCQSDFIKNKYFNDIALKEICEILSNDYQYIFIDYIQDIELENQRNKAFNYQLKDLIRSLNGIATEKQISFIINAQTNSNIKAPFYGLDAVGDSYDIVRKAKNVYSLWNCQKEAKDGNNRLKEEKKLKSYQDKDNQEELNYLLISCLKSRSGMAGLAQAFKTEPENYIITSETGGYNPEGFQKNNHNRIALSKEL